MGTATVKHLAHGSVSRATGNAVQPQEGRTGSLGSGGKHCSRAHLLGGGECPVTGGGVNGVEVEPHNSVVMDRRTTVNVS